MNTIFASMDMIDYLQISLILINNFHFFILLYFVFIVYTKFSKKSNYNFGKYPRT